MIVTWWLVLKNGSINIAFSSVTQSCLTLWPHEPQHAKPPCPSPTTCLNKPMSIESVMPSNHLSSVISFSSCPQSFPASVFQMNQLFPSGGQSIGVSASTSVLPMNTQDWSPLGWTGCISSQFKGLSRVLSSTTIQKHQFFSTQKHTFT